MYNKCTECKYWETYYKHLMNDLNIPYPCENCNPFDPEDDRERPKFINREEE